MELDTLRVALESDDEQVFYPGSSTVARSSGFLEQVVARHGRSSQPSSQQLVAVVMALKEMVEAEGLEPTPTALFAAAMSGLEGQNLSKSGSLLAPMIAALDALLPYVPNAVLRTKFSSFSAVFRPIMEAALAGRNAATARAAVGVLCQALGAFDAADWLVALPSFSLVLRLCSDVRPKIRKRAHQGLAEALAAAAAQSQVLAAASEQVALEAERVLAGPEAAARAAANAPHKKQKSAEGAIVAAAAAALHLMGALRQSMGALQPEAAKKVCQYALALLPLHQPLLSRQATEVVLEFYGASGSEDMASRLTAAEVMGHVRLLLANELSVAERRDADCMASELCLLTACQLRLHALESDAAATGDYRLTLGALPKVCRHLLPLLTAELDAVRAAALDALLQTLRGSLSAPAVRASVRAAAVPGSAPTGVVGVVSVLDAGLVAARQEAWPATLRVVAELFAALGRGPGSALVTPLLERLDALCAGAAEAETNDGEAPGIGLALAAQACMGAALSTLGARAVLSVLPLGILEALRDGGAEEQRTWLLPLMRRHGGAGEAAYWATDLFPLANALGQRAASAAKRKAAQEETVCATLEAQVWATLPAFMNWAEDGASVWSELESPLLGAFKKSEQLQTIVCNTLSTLCLNLLSFYARVGEPLGHATPGSVFAAEVDDTEEAAIDGEDDDFDVRTGIARSGVTEAAAAGAGGLTPVTGPMPGHRPRSGHSPVWYAADVAAANLDDLRRASSVWLPALLDGFLGANSKDQGLIHSTLALLARVCEPAAVARAFKVVGAKAAQSAAGEAADPVQHAALLELALALAPGLDARGLGPLVRLTRPLLEQRESGLQKKAYKVLAYVCVREDYVQDERARKHLLEMVIANQATSMSPAKRYRLKTVEWAVVQLLQGDSSKDAETRARVAALIGEIVLSLKEVNAKTRTAAFETLVELAHTLHDTAPPALVGGEDAAMDTEDGAPAGPASAALESLGGLSVLVTAVLGGLVGATPHMISASVMALARLFHEFSSLLLGLVPDLLPAVLSLLRSKAREIIKSVLGFVKVVVSRLPVPQLLPAIPAILEGILLWAEDSKNKFRLKVRVIIERMVRRCGVDAVQPAIPETHRALLTHIRKDLDRQERRRTGASEDGDAGSARSRHTAAPTSVWDAKKVFSTVGGTTVAKSSRSRGPAAASARGVPRTAAGAGAVVDTDPLDLRDAATSRSLMRAAAGASGRRGAGSDGEDGDDFPRDDTGRLVVRDPEAAAHKKKRGRSSEFFDSDDSDFEDLQGLSGLDLALKGATSVARAPSIAASIGGRSLARSRQGDRAASTKTRRAQHTGDRFKAARAGGDVKKGRLEPYAYWPLDRRLMNRRASKARVAKEGLKSVVRRDAHKPAKRAKRGPAAET